MRLSRHPYILYVDDNRDSCELIALMFRLADERYQIITISDAAEAALLIAGNSFDLYILDFVMPEVSGAELCKLIRQTDPDIPILFYSGMARPVDRMAAMAAGATEYLIKPDDLDKLIATAERLLGHRQTA